MAQVAEIKFGQKVMEKETEKKISEIEGLYPVVGEVLLLTKELYSFYTSKSVYTCWGVLL